MSIVYRGKAFREAHQVGLRELARVVGVRHHTLILLEQNKRECINRGLVGRIMGYFKSRDIPCTWDDLLAYEPPAEEQGSAPDEA